MSELSRFLANRLGNYGEQVDFSRAIGASPGTVNKWISGENTPNFESCLRIASYFKVEPRVIFKMAGKLDYYQLYLRQFKKLEFQAQLHARLQHLLDSGLDEEVETLVRELESRLTTREDEVRGD